MPTISRFYGIAIRMYFWGAEHNPPHIHAIYGEDMAAFAIETGEVIDGELPPKATALVEEWVLMNKAALLEMWETQEFRKLEPMK